MQNYLAIIKRNDFDKLYISGYIFIHNAIPFDGELKDHIADHNLFHALTAFMDSYEYSNEYLILEFRIPVYTGTVVEISLEDVSVIYALDAMAQHALAKTLDPRIQIQVSPWSEYFYALNKKQALRAALKGLENCFTIFDITSADQCKVRQFLPLDLVEDLFDDLFARIRPQGAKSIWIYLLRYQRHNPYFKDRRGYFCDAMHAYENYLQQQEIDNDIIDESPLAELLNKPKTQFNEIYNSIIDSKLNKYQIDNCNYLAAASIFLYLKSYFGGEGITSLNIEKNELISTLYSKYGFDFALAVGLLGLNLGHKFTAYFYYQKKNIKIFNNNLVDEKDHVQNEIACSSEKKSDQLIMTQDDIEELLKSYVQRIHELEQINHELTNDKIQTDSEHASYEKQKNEAIAELNQEDLNILEETISELEDNKYKTFAPNDQTINLNQENKLEAIQDTVSKLADTTSGTQDDLHNLGAEAQDIVIQDAESQLADRDSENQEEQHNLDVDAQDAAIQDTVSKLPESTSGIQEVQHNLDMDAQDAAIQDTESKSESTSGIQEEQQNLDVDAQDAHYEDDLNVDNASQYITNQTENEKTKLSNITTHKKIKNNTQRKSKKQNDTVTSNARHKNKNISEKCVDDNQYSLLALDDKNHKR